MASSVVGVLKVLLTADGREFEAGLKDAQRLAKAWSTDLGSIGRQATAVGSALTRTLTLPILGIGIASVKAASDFESSFAGVRKTVNATEPEFAALAQGLRDMAKEIPVNVNELNKVAEAAGQLGIKKGDILQFTRTMADLGVTTNLTAEEAATATANIQNIFGAAGKDVDRFGATLVALGNAGASTEKDIIEMGKRIAGAGNQVGLSQAQVLSFASALSSVGINAEAGGSAISRVFLKINDAVFKGGATLNEFARIAGMTGPAFKKAFQDDAATATTAFISGLARLKAAGENVNATIEGVVGKNIILKDTLMRAAGAGTLLADQLSIGNKAWQENTALTTEAAERYKTFESQLKTLWNQVQDVAITLGTSLLPTLKDLVTVSIPLVNMLGQAASMFASLPEPIRLTIVGYLGLVAAVGPLLSLYGYLARVTSTVIGAFTAKGIATRALIPVLGTLRVALIAVGTSFVGMGALAAVGAAAIYEVGKSFVNAYNHWRSGKQMWDFFAARDEDNFVRRWLGLSTGIRNADIALSGAADSADEFVGPLEQAATSMARLGAESELTKKQIKALKDAEKDRLDALKAAGALEGKIREENLQFAAQAVGAINKEKGAWRDFYNWLGERRMENDAARLPLTSTMDQKALFSGSMFAGFKQAVKENNPFDPDKLPTNDWGAKIFDGVAQGIVNAISGGGDKIKTIAATLGKNFMSGFVANFSESFKATFLGKMLTDLLPGIGALLGPLADKAWGGLKKLFGIGINDEIKKFNKEIQTSREALLKQFGSLERIARLGKAVGVDLAGAWHHQGEAGLKAFKELSEEFAKRVGEMEDELEGFQDELQNTFDEARDLGYILDKDGNLISVSFEKMQSAAEEFGVDLQSLGKSFQAARLAADAGKIINAFELLAKGGTDAGTILFGMKDEISQLVNDSIQFGTKIPENMRPWIAELIRAGLLLDDNGDAITDIGRIQFGAAIETQFEAISRKIIDLISKIDELINTLLHEFKPALDDATKPVPAPWDGWSDPPVPSALAFGQGFASGTLGRLGKWFGNFPKTGFSTALHGAEAVITPDQAPAFAMDVLSGLNQPQAQRSAQQAQPPVNVRSVIENRMFMDGHELKRWILEAVTTAIENNERGIRSRQRDALGITS